ncbi:MAG: prolyl oligopeptidase [Bacteroidia bacterium]|nr:MAG: prolyl oligopeptidase [Bacteroidia bacterium]
MKLIISILLLSCSFPVLAQEGWTPEAMIHYKRVGSTAISGDGRLVAYTVSTPLLEGEKSEYQTHIWIARADGTTNRQFTFGDKSCINPSFSPDGNYLAFTSSRGADGKNQVWIMRLTGGEARRVTRAKNGVGSYRWSPDGSRIAYTMTDPPGDDDEKRKKEKRDWKVADEEYSHAHLYVVRIGEAEQEPEVQRLTGGNFHVTSFDWSPDGTFIAFSHQANPTVDVWPTTDISIVPSDSGAVRSMVAMRGSDSNPLYSPDGQWIAFVSDGGDPRWPGHNDVYIIPASGGEARKLAETHDRRPGIIAWSGDSKGIYYSETDRTSSRVFSLPVAGGAPRVVTTGTGTFGGADFSKDGSLMSFIHQTSETPPEVAVSGTRSFKPRTLSNVHAGYVQYPLGKTEVLSWKSKDGREIEGLLTYPVNYVKGRTYPLVLNIHGGPAGVFTQSFTAASGIYPIQAFAQEGYAVLRPNPRGSSGYGKEFRFANVMDWGFGDYDDDMAGVDKVIALGIAHPDSLVVCGWSYGGYMTSFIVTKTDRFKAASVGAGVTNLISFVGTADIPSFLPDYFGGEFWDRQDVYIRHSAIYHAGNITTPTQIIHGEEDKRVPLSQGSELYVALKRRGIPTEMIMYPRTPHGPQEPKFIRDIGERILAWFNRHLGRTRTKGMAGSR